MGRTALVLMAMLTMGCASQAVRTARDNAEIERLRLENDYLRKRVEQEISVSDSGFYSAKLPSCTNPSIVRTVLSKEAAEAEGIRLRNRRIDRIMVGEKLSDVGREKTILHFWEDELGNQWARIFIKNVSPNNIVRFEVAGIDGVAPKILKPGDVALNLWVIVGKTFCFTGEERTIVGEYVNKLEYCANVSPNKTDSDCVIDGAYYCRGFMVGAE